MTKRVAVVGSRGFADYKLLTDILDRIELSEIISGGARGADSLAARYASERGFKITEFKPDWKRFGKSAGYRRNVTIVDNAELVVAFWDGKSKGTKHSIDLAKKMNKDLLIIQFGESNDKTN